MSSNPPAGNGPQRRGALRRLAGLGALWATAAAWPARDARAQSSSFTPPELEQLLAPIALYPDAVLAQVLIAAAYPAEVRLAADWLRRNPTFKDKGDAAVRAVDDQPWDASVRSLVAFPSVLEQMDANPDWTQAVGDAFIDQKADVMSAIQALRTKAQLAGTLQSSDKLTVMTEDRTILIQSPNPQVVYVPSYNPTVVYGAWAYPAYPPVYLPPPPGYYVGTALAAGIAFGIGIAVTNAIWGGFDWRRGDVNINVNHFNNIHVNNVQNFRRDGRYDFDRSHRRDVPMNDRASRERVQKQAVATRDRADFDRPQARPDRPDRPDIQRPDPQRPDRPARPDVARPDASRPATRPADGGRPDPQRPAPRPQAPDRGAFEGIDRPTRDKPAIDRVPSARPAPQPMPQRPAPQPSARPAPRPMPQQPTPRPAPTSRPAPSARPAPAARPAGGARHAR